MQLSWTIVAIIAGLNAVTLAAMALLIARVYRPVRPPDPPTGAVPVRFLLAQGALRDATDGALAALGLADRPDLQWDDLRAALSARFADLPRDVRDGGHFPARDAADRASLSIKMVDKSAGLVWVDLVDPDANASARHHLMRLQPELARLDRMLSATDDLIWITEDGGAPLFGNAAWRDMAERHPNVAWLRQSALPGSAPEPREVSLPRAAGGERHFELRAHPGEGATVWVAAATDAVVQAREAQRNVLQTLTKSFVHLPIGLAIFDKSRALTLFNPALVDLTTLPAEFLSGRPDLMTFFDALREARMMPETKDFSSWRERIANLLNETRDDRFYETWTLPTGLTYRITGRPHTDGAIAFILEDISTEVSLTRRFRSELRLLQAALDAMP